MEKKITVPPAAVARIAPCSQPGTSTQTTVTSARPPRAPVTAAAVATRARAAAPTACPAARAGGGAGARGGGGAGAGGGGAGEGVGERGAREPHLLGRRGDDAERAGGASALRGSQREATALAGATQDRHGRR